MSGPDEFTEICRDFIDLINAHVGTYVDACAGFAGNKARVERQVAKIMRRQSANPNAKDGTIAVFASFDDPDHPDAIHHRIVAAKEFIAANSEAGSHEQIHGAAAVVFLFAKWDEVVRPALARAKGVSSSDITLNIMGDLRLLRHAILHNNGVLRLKDHGKLKLISGAVTVGPLNLSNHTMHTIFAEVKSGCAELICSHLGLPFTRTGPEGIKEIAMTGPTRRHQFRPV